MSSLKTFVAAALLVASAARAELAPPDAHAAKAMALIQEAEAELKLSAANAKTGGHFITAVRELNSSSLSIKYGWAVYAREVEKKERAETAKAAKATAPASVKK